MRGWRRRWRWLYIIPTTNLVVAADKTINLNILEAERSNELERLAKLAHRDRDVGRDNNQASVAEFCDNAATPLCYLVLGIAEVRPHALQAPSQTASVSRNVKAKGFVNNHALVWVALGDKSPSTDHPHDRIVVECGRKKTDASSNQQGHDKR
ncbi:MAG: hypothetical protein WC740_06365 [Verrucomicrobiia bacterium]